jgi:nickel transport protein
VSRRAAAAGALALALAAPGGARAHEILHEVRRDGAVAVRAWFPDGESLAYVQAEVFSPADPAIPHWKGRTDRNGWLAFVPDLPGRWRVRVVDATGHGLDTVVEVAAPGAVQAGGAAGPPSSAAFALRPAVGVALIAAIFAFLVAVARRRRHP